MEHVDRAVAAYQMEALDVQCMAFIVPHKLLGMYAMCITILLYGFKYICWCLCTSVCCSGLRQNSIGTADLCAYVFYMRVLIFLSHARTTIRCGPQL